MATGESTIDIQCWFIHGSDALGCVVVLVSDHPGVNNETMNMSRNAMLASGTFNLIQHSSCYTRIFASDIEASGTLSGLTIEGNVQPNSIQNTSCSSMISLFSNMKVINNILNVFLVKGSKNQYFIVAIILPLILIAITTIAIIVSILAMKLCNKGKFSMYDL